MEKRVSFNLNVFKRKTIKSLAVAVLVTSLVLVIYQFFFLTLIEEYNTRRILESSKMRERGAEEFVCWPSGMSIAMSKVNDDYCDCPDGSDESTTSACPNGSFLCHLTQATIPSSRVNDGICDCCDGSDEWDDTPFILAQSIDIQKKTVVFHRPCPNVCAH